MFNLDFSCVGHMMQLYYTKNRYSLSTAKNKGTLALDTHALTTGGHQNEQKEKYSARSRKLLFSNKIYRHLPV